MMNEIAVVALRRGEDGKPYVDSRNIAAKFSKEHRNVLRDIENLINQDVRVALNFEPKSYVAENGKNNRCYHMNRDGFSLLTMGFTGKDALHWKLAYIEAFNAMEAELKLPPLKRMTAKEALWAALEAEERYDAAEAARIEAVAKVRSVQRQNRDLAEHSYELQKQNSLIVETAESLIAILGPKNNMSLRDAANRLQQPQHKFNDLLHDKGWIYRRPTNPGEQLGRWHPYANQVANGNLVDREFVQDRNSGRITALTPDFGFVDPELFRTFKAVGVTNAGMRKIVQMDDLPNPDAPALQRERRNQGM